MEGQRARAGESIRAGLDARVSSDQQEEEQTIASQVAALRERVAADGFTLDEEWYSWMTATAGPRGCGLRWSACAT